MVMQSASQKGVTAQPGRSGEELEERRLGDPEEGVSRKGEGREGRVEEGEKERQSGASWHPLIGTEQEERSAEEESVFGRAHRNWLPRRTICAVLSVGAALLI
eukprot:2841082-Rhodomonas_salina.1